MIKNYIKVGLRNLLRNRTTTAIHLFGLTVGLTCFWMILQYVSFEKSYDRFHKNHDTIYRVQLDQYKNGELIFKSSENYPAVGPALVTDFPEIESFARLYNLGAKNNLVIVNEHAPNGPIQFKHRRFLYADSTFLSMLSYRLLAGDPETALREPFSMVISESYAKKYFGNENPLGKTLRMRDDDFNDETCKVTGVVEDPPHNTHLKFDALISYTTLFTRWEKARLRYDHNWNRKDMYTYIRVKAGTDVAALQSLMPDFIKRHNPDLEKQFRKDELILQPVSDIHLYSKLTDEAEANGNGDAVYYLTLIAISILLIGWINYVNLSTARSMDRAREVGIRKVVGAERRRLMSQFLVESLMMNLSAAVLSLIAVYFFWPGFQQLSDLPIGFELFLEPWFAATTILVVAVGTFAAGLYPAMVMSTFKPIQVLKGNFSTSGRGVLLRKVLVVSQFIASSGLIIGTITVYRQIEHMRSADLGIDIDQTVVVERPGVVDSREARAAGVEAFKTELKTHAAVKNVTASFVVPGKKLRFKAEVKQMSHSIEQAVPLAVAGMDYDFIEAFDMKLLAGRAFSPDFPKDVDTSVILTKSAVKLLGFETPESAVGKEISVPLFNWNAFIVGVVDDYHHESLELQTQPTLFSCGLTNVEYFMIKVSPHDLPATINSINKTWNKTFPGNPFDYFFLDEFFNRQYRGDETFGKVFSLFALLAVFVGCLGLFGLSSFTVSRRLKEIAIRKICGAPAMTLFMHLSRDSLLWIFVGSLLAWPLMYVLMEQWLSKFAYRIDLTVDIFALSSIVLLLIAQLTIAFQTTRAALANPVQYLRYE